MKTLLTILLACAITHGHAQAILRPAEHVEALQRNNRPFYKYALFPHTVAFQDAQLPQVTGLDFQNHEVLALLAAAPSAVELSIPTATAPLILQLYQVNFLAEGFEVKLARATQSPDEPNSGLHYRGVCKGISGSVVALSIYPGEVVGLISSPELGNLTLAKYRGTAHKRPGLHALYAEAGLPQGSDFTCHTPDGQRGYAAVELENHAELRNSNNCVNVYLEVDNDVFVDKGGMNGTSQYIMAVFNQVATLYANERIKLNLAQLYIWNTISPYSAYDAYGLLIQFKDKRAGTIKADAGMLVSYKGGGGIAVVDGLCDAFNLAYAGIGKSYQTVPNYSFTVMVMTHELGHVLGSHHTHACVWNGNNTALDGCPGFTDGGCSTPPIPKQGGTIMSYCHITAGGINFSLGFGTQPGNLIRNRIATATCMSNCANSVTPPSSSCGDISFSLKLDDYGNEITWEILDATNAVVDKGGPYAIRSNGTVVEKKLCLPAGCYTLRVLDSRGDGLCCRYGNGSFALVDHAGAVLAEGGQFTREAATTFCIDEKGQKKSPGTPPPPPTPSSNLGCTDIQFNNFTVLSFGDSQDQGVASVLENGRGIELRNNAWKAIALDYNISVNTFIEFEFRSTEEGEIHAIGFDNDLSLSTIYTFQLWGTQLWGYQDFNNYAGTGTWKRYTIPVGQKYTGQTKYLFFACDNDAALAGGNSQFRNVRIYEKNPCPRLENLEDRARVQIFPNPAKVLLNLHLENFPTGAYQIQIVDVLGREIFSQKLNLTEAGYTFSYPVANLPTGMYGYQVKGLGQQVAGKFLVKPEQ
jgi:hypothetical protein